MISKAINYPIKKLKIWNKKWWLKKLFRIYKFFSWMKFHWNSYDFDYGYLIEMMIKKLTFMGITIYTNNWIVDRKQTMSSIWNARKKLIQFKNSFEIAEMRNKKEMIEKFGQELFSEMNLIPKEDGSGCLTVKFDYYTKTPVDKATLNKMIKLHHKQLGNEQKVREEKMKEFCTIFQKDIYTWWD